MFHPALGTMIKQLRGQGAAWAINTGRSLGQTLQGLGQYGLFMEPDYIIARECDVYKPGILRKWTDFGSWNRQARKDNHRFVRTHQAFFAEAKAVVESSGLAEFLEGDHGELGIVAQTDEAMDRLCQWIDVHHLQHPDIGYQRNGIYLRFAHSGYSKGSALGELSRLLGLTAEQVFTAGDNYNDLSMLSPRYARQIACPGNALPAIKDHVRSVGGFVAERPASEGMIQAITHFFGGGGN